MQDILALEAGGSAISTMSDDQLQLWELTLSSLLDTLETSHTKTVETREKLEKITRETV